MITLYDVKADRSIERIAGYCPNSGDFIDLVNKATRMLMRRGDWAGTLEMLYMCVRSGCIVWPRYVLEVRRLSWCGVDVAPQNMWGSFLPRAANSQWRAGCSWHTANSFMASMGWTSVFQDILGDGRTIRAYARCNADYGKTVTVFGTDNNGQPLQTNTNGVWTMGQVLTLNATFASTTTFVRSIDYIIKDATSCPVNVYAYNATTNVLEDIAQYDPGETRPSYSKSRLLLPGSSCGQSACSRGVTALVKLKFIPALVDTDLVLIDNLDALGLAMQAVKYREQGDRDNAKTFEFDAVAELNLQLADEFPDETFVADNRVFADRSFTNRCF